MATSILTFKLTDYPESVLDQTFTAQVDPPANIRGKLCYVEVTVWAWDYTAVSQYAAREAAYLTCNWTQPLSSFYNNGVTQPTAVLASFQNNFSFSAGPVLCQIPDGPHEVKFRVRRLDGSNISDAVTDVNHTLICLKIIPADSRQPPIGV